MEWHTAIDQLKDHLVHISTPRGSGTGWLVSSSNAANLCAIATAAHVVGQAHYWEEPIRIQHLSSGQSKLFRADTRAIHIENRIDSAAIVINRNELPLPESPLQLQRRGFYMRPGVKIGWLGFPAMHQSDACFFSGRVSHYNEDLNRYLVDGVAINGVSGGPAFRLHVDHLEIIGIVSAYIANRVTGEALPGLAVIQDATQFYDMSERFRTLDEAQAKQTPPEDVVADAPIREEPDPE